jgi:AcrR family transcriptional regulator
MQSNSGKSRRLPSEDGSDSGTGDLREDGTATSDDETITADWQRRVVDRSLRTATKKSIDRGFSLVLAAAALLERSHGEGFTVQEVADEAGQSLRTLYLYFESKDDLLLAVSEEALKTYARMIRTAISELDDELERLAGAILASALLPEYTKSGIDIGLARHRLRLGAMAPELMAKSQLPILDLLKELTRNATQANRIRGMGEDEAAYLLAMINTGFITSRTLGNEYGSRPPDAASLTEFCLLGLGATLEPGWIDGVAARIRLPKEPFSVDSRAKRSGA